MDDIVDGIVFGESPRWREGRVWFSDWARGRVSSVEPGGGDLKVEVEVASFPLCFDFLPDGDLLLVSAADRALLRRGPGGELTTYADLGGLAETPYNELVVDGHGNAWVNNIGYDFPQGEPRPGIVVLVTPEGRARQVADDLQFPNGMVVTPDDRTLIVAESHAERLTAYDIDADRGLSCRRVWAETPGDHPDGICLDTQGAVWFADVGNAHCRRVGEGGEVLDTVDFGRGAFSCTLSRAGEPTLFVVGQDYGGDADAPPSGVLRAFPAPQGGAGHP